MTNYSKIVSMPIDELAQWLDKCSSIEDTPWMTWFTESYCAQCESIKVNKENAKELLGFDLLYKDEAECAYCEIHNECKYFQDMERPPNNVTTIKLWLTQPENISSATIKSEDAEVSAESSCSGCIYENVDDSTVAISNCICCNRLVDTAKNDYYKKNNE